MFKNKTVLALVLAIILLIAIAIYLVTSGIFVVAPEEQFVVIATGGTGGTYYPLGGALAQMISDNVEGLIVTAQSGNASVANCNLISRGQIETGFSQANT
jgi:TRAP transporter TAXI family solute receptor